MAVAANMRLCRGETGLRRDEAILLGLCIATLESTSRLKARFCKRKTTFFCIFIIAKFSESSKRFLTRGIDDSGAVANSVETETFLLDQEGRIAAHCQLRGSVPVFWEQPGINFGQHKCDIIRKTEGSLSAAKRKEFSTAVV